MNLTNKQLFALILAILGGGVGITVLVYVGSRLDSNVRLAATTGALTMGGTLIGIVATMLTGKERPSPGDLPPGSTMSSTQTDTVKSPPV